MCKFYNSTRLDLSRLHLEKRNFSEEGRTGYINKPIEDKQFQKRLLTEKSEIVNREIEILEKMLTTNSNHRLHRFTQIYFYTSNPSAPPPLPSLTPSAPYRHSSCSHPHHPPTPAPLSRWHPTP